MRYIHISGQSYSIYGKQVVRDEIDDNWHESISFECSCDKNIFWWASENLLFMNIHHSQKSTNDYQKKIVFVGLHFNITKRKKNAESMIFKKNWKRKEDKRWNNCQKLEEMDEARVSSVTNEWCDPKYSLLDLEHHPTLNTWNIFIIMKLLIMFTWKRCHLRFFNNN